MPAVDPTVELLAALNKALSDGRITPEEYGRRAKMISTAKAQREEDRRHSKQIFDKFDVDHSGHLDIGEFTALVSTLGGAMTKAEIDAAFHSLDSDGGGTVDFEEFYTWWSTPEIHSAKPTKLSALRLALTTQELKEKSSAAARKLNEALAANAAKKGEDDSQIINLQVAVGDFNPGSSLKVTYENNEQAAGELQKEFGAAESDVVLSVAFSAAPGKEAFDLGQLSGKLKDLLSMQEEIKFKAIKNDVKTIGETVVFRVNLVIDGSEKLIADTVAMITTNLIKSASIVLEVNEKIGTPFTKELQARLNMNLKLAIGGGATLMSVLGVGGKKKKSRLGKSKEPQLLSVLTSRMREANLKIKTDTVQEALALVVGSPAPFNNFSDVRPLLSMLLAELPWEELPDTVMDTYKIATENLVGLHSIAIAANKAVVRVETHLFDAVKLLPNVEALKAAIKAANGEEDEEEEEGGAKEPVEAPAESGGVRWLFPPAHGLKEAAEPVRASFTKEEITVAMLNLWPGVKIVPEESSPFKEALEILASRETVAPSALFTNTVLNDAIKEGGLYQPTIRLRAVKDAKLGNITIQLHGTTSVMSTVQADFSLSSLKMPTDGTWWEIPIGDPLKGVRDGELGLKGTTVISISATVQTDAELVNGLRIDHFALYELAAGTPPPAAVAPKSEAVAADVVRPICKGGHPMVWARLPKGGWFCDLCKGSHVASTFHWQCRPCDADYCPSCYDKSGTKGATADVADSGSASE